MNLDRRKNAGFINLSSSAQRLIYPLAVITGIIILGLSVYSFYIAERASKIYSPLVDAAIKIKLETTAAHLWFEEIGSSNTHKSLEAVWKHLDQADWYANAMLEGGKNSEGTFIPFDNNEMQREIREIQKKLAEFREITRQKVAAQKTFGPGSDIDNRYNAIFKELIARANQLKAGLRQIITQFLRYFRSIQITQIILVILFFLYVWISFWYFNRRQTGYILSQLAANEKIKKSESGFRALFNNVKSGVAIYEAKDNGNDFIFKDFNRAGEQIDNIRKEDLIGKSILEIFPGVKEFGLFDVLKNVWLTGKPEYHPVSIYKDRRITGWRENDIYKLPSGEIVAIYDDITKRKQAEKEREKLEAEAIRNSQLTSIGEIAAGVAHEINNPITSVINLAQILFNESNPESSEHDIAGRIIKEGDRIADIVSNILSFARGNRKTEKNPMKLSEIISDTLVLTKAQIREDQIQLSVDVSLNLPKIIANQQQLQQVFLNIIINARYALNQKYPGMHENKIFEILGEELIIDECPYVRVIFQDRGTGIPANVIEKVINPFYSTKPTGTGTGLGLSISHSIISDHGGYIRIESTEHEFTRVIIDLPVAGKEKDES